jgi:hypothetical protein
MCVDDNSHNKDNAERYVKANYDDCQAAGVT